MLMICRLSLITVLLLLISSVWGYDSTGTFQPTTPTSNRIIMLEHGSAGYNYSTSGFGNSDGGRLYTSSCSNALCTAYFYNTTTCPTGFTPYVVVTPYQMQNMGTGWNAVCVTGTPVAGDYNNYKITVNMTNVLNYTSQTYSQELGVSFEWAIYCYPSSRTVPSYDSACSPPTNVAMPILIWDQGYINTGSGSQTENFSTHRTCPPTYSPYISVSVMVSAWSSTGWPSLSSWPSSADQNQIAQGGGACISNIASIPGNSNQYSVTMLRARSWLTPNNISDYPAGITDQNQYENYPFPMFTNGVIRSTPDYSNHMELQWILHCYPPDVALPQNQMSTNLSDATNPYNLGCNVNVAPYK